MLRSVRLRASEAHVRGRSHRAKANAKIKKIEEPAKEIKERISNIKENFRFRSV